MWANRALLSALLLWSGITQAAAEGVVCSADRVTFRTAETLQTLQVEIADDETERARGLMFRHRLAQGSGMLFIYDSPRKVSFWMRNTVIPLDIVFMDRTGTIRHIHRNALPLDETPIPGAGPLDPRPERLMILEIGGGEADRLGLAVGQPMAHPRLPRDGAALPCRADVHAGSPSR